MPTVNLADRAVIEVAGADTMTLLQSLVTCQMAGLAAGEARYGALLTPQGKILTDFCVTPWGAGVLMDLPQAQAADFMKRLTLYRLRAQVTVTPRDDLHVVAVWGESAPPSDAMVVFTDPRAAALGLRIITAQTGPEASDPKAYAALRVTHTIPQGGVDFVYGDTFPHDANLDLLHGVDFTKGCYVGQEVVSRVQHRGSARKRIVRLVVVTGQVVTGQAILAGDMPVGQIGSVADGACLAQLRLDKVEEAQAAGHPLVTPTASLQLAPSHVR